MHFWYSCNLQPQNVYYINLKWLLGGSSWKRPLYFKTLDYTISTVLICNFATDVIYNCKMFTVLAQSDFWAGVAESD